MPILDIQAEGAIAAITFRHDGKHVVGGTGLGTVRKWGTGDGREVGRVMRVGEFEVGAVATSKDGQWIVGGTTTGSAIVWSGKTHEKTAEIKTPHEDWVLSVDISPDCKTFATGSYDETVALWELATAKKVWGPVRHPSHVGGIRFSPSGDRLATITWSDLAIHIFDSSTGDLVFRIPNSVCTVHANTFAWTDNGQRLYSAYEMSINQYDVTSKSELPISTWKVDPHIHVQHISVSNSGQFVACSIDRSGGDRAINFWDTLTQTKICGHIRLAGRLRSVAISQDDTQLAFGRYDDKITIYDLRELFPHSYFVIRNTPALVSAPQSCSTNIPLMHVIDRAFDPWIQGKLGNAEAVFSDEISTSNRDYHALANRALIRARSKQFREAIDDAEKSINIQKSSISLIAKSIALVGDGKVNDGHRACDLAIAHSDPKDGSFLRVIKSIILCMAEDSEDSISHVNDMVVEMDDRSLDHFVPAQMYFMFGERQLSRGEYERAAESFRLAQPAIPLPESPYLTAISLIFCWHFEDLSLNAKRGLCEALCGADRPKEAVDTLLEIMDTFNEEVRPSPLTLDWKRDFTKRCVLTLERTGDSAVASNDHETASAHYAFVISLSEVRPKEKLKKWINAKLRSNNSWKDVLRASVELNLSRITMYKAACEVLAESGRLTEAIECFDTLKNDSEWTTNPDDDWMLVFRHTCGDVAMKLRQHDIAIDHYSDAVSHQPLKPDALIKRSKARAAKRSWEEALQDAEEALKLDPSSPSGYEVKRDVLHLAERYDEAIAVFEDMLSMIENSTDAKINGLRKNYATPSETKAAIENAADEIQRSSPIILIDTVSGRLCDKPERKHIFKEDQEFKILVSSMTRKLDRKQVKEVVGNFLKYVMFSHVWQGDEPLHKEVIDAGSVWELSKTSQNEKLQGFCRKARNLNFRWAWSDTCCIDKLIDAILNESLRSMYKWYANSAATVILLAGLEHPTKIGDLTKSLWMQRAWTLQELLAPNVILFFDPSWKPYLNDTRANHKDSQEIMQELADAIKISQRTIISFQPDKLSVREKLRLASKRQATREEDIAYSLIGIFKSDTKPHYGDGVHTAVGQLLEEIVNRVGAVTVLDWVGKSSPYNSCLPDSLLPYNEPPHRPSPIEGEAMEASVAQLRTVLPRDEVARFYASVSRLPHANFLNRRLSLPCIIFQTMSLRVVELGHNSPTVFAAQVSGVDGEVEFRTVNILSLRDASKLLFVHPWIHHLQGPHGSSPTSSAHTVFVHPVDDQTFTRGLQMIARLQSPFNALLLREHSPRQYKRVAAEAKIIVNPKIGSLNQVRVDTLTVVDEERKNTQ